MNIARKLAEQNALDLQRKANEAKGKHKRAAMEAAELAIAKCDRMAHTHHSPSRGYQMAFALVDSIGLRKIPAHCAQLAQMIANSVQTHARA